MTLILQFVGLWESGVKNRTGPGGYVGVNFIFPWIVTAVICFTDALRLEKEDVQNIKYFLFDILSSLTIDILN